MVTKYIIIFFHVLIPTKRIRRERYNAVSSYRTDKSGTHYLGIATVMGMLLRDTRFHLPFDFIRRVFHGTIQRIPHATCYPSSRIYFTLHAFPSARNQSRPFLFPHSLLDLHRRWKCVRALAGTLASPPPSAMKMRASFGLFALLMALVLLVVMTMKIQNENLQVPHLPSILLSLSLLPPVFPSAFFSPLDLDQMDPRHQSFESAKVRDTGTGLSLFGPLLSYYIVFFLVLGKIISALVFGFRGG